MEMTDYEKLKIANELCEKTDGYHFFCDYSNRYGVSEITLCHKGRYNEDCSDIDDLINKLKELTQPKPKYEVGQEVFWLVSDIIYTGMVVCCKPNANRWKIKIDDELIEIDDCHLYPSREALIDAQIEYWHSLKEPVNPEDMQPKFEGEVKGFNHCEHEYDALRDDCGYKFLRHINGTSYYVSHKDNDVYCGCGVAADYAHRCKCRKCGAGKITHSRCKKCGEFYR